MDDPVLSQPDVPVPIGDVAPDALDGRVTLLRRVDVISWMGAERRAGRSWPASFTRARSVSPTIAAS